MKFGRVRVWRHTEGVEVDVPDGWQYYAFIGRFTLAAWLPF